MREKDPTVKILREYYEVLIAYTTYYSCKRSNFGCD